LLGGESYSYRLTNDFSMAVWPYGFSTYYSMGVVFTFWFLSLVSWGFRFLVSLALNCQDLITDSLRCGVLAYISI